MALHLQVVVSVMLKDWIWDAQNGYAFCTDLDEIRDLALTVGPAYDEVQNWYAFNYTGLLEDLQNNTEMLRVLECQLRWMLRVAGDLGMPDLRAAIPTNLGRTRMVAWNNNLFTQRIRRAPVIDPDQVVFVSGSAIINQLTRTPPSLLKIPTFKPCPMEYRSGKHTCCPACDGTGKVRE